MREPGFADSRDMAKRHWALGLACEAVKRETAEVLTNLILFLPALFILWLWPPGGFVCWTLYLAGTLVGALLGFGGLRIEYRLLRALLRSVRVVCRLRFAAYKEICCYCGALDSRYSDWCNPELG